MSYRILNLGDTIQAGDEYFIGEGYKGDWVRVFAGGYKLVSDHRLHRRRIHATPSAPQRHELLNPGDTLQEGDELYDTGLETWRKVTCVGAKASCTMHYRRPLHATPSAPTHRLLTLGEDVQPDDEVIDALVVGVL